MRVVVSSVSCFVPHFIHRFTFILALLGIGFSSQALAQNRVRPPNVCQRGEARLLVHETLTVNRIVDGDTVVVTRPNGENVSFCLLSIDTPETHYMGKTQGVWGDRAAARLGELLPVGSSVNLQLDRFPCDRYARVLAYIWQGRRLINYEMARDGFAVNYCIAPNFKHCKSIGDIVRVNVREKRGIFSDSSLMLPYDWRRVVSGRDYDKFVGNSRSHNVFKPGENRKVPIADRVFFYRESDIRPPFRLASP
jgi:micrococcal nuclease